MRRKMSGWGLQLRELLVAGDGLAVIDQDAHPHAAIGRLQDRAGQQAAGLIAMEDEVLQVDRALRRGDELHAQDEPVGARIDDAQARSTVACVDPGHGKAAQARGTRIGDRARGHARDVGSGRQCPAAGQQQGRGEHCPAHDLSVFLASWFAPALALPRRPGSRSATLGMRLRRSARRRWPGGLDFALGGRFRRRRPARFGLHRRRPWGR